MHYSLLFGVCILVNHIFVSPVRKADFTFFQRMPEGNILVGFFQTVWKAGFLIPFLSLNIPVARLKLLLSSSEDWIADPRKV